MYVTDTNNASFESDVLSSDIPVLVDFWATWCVACKSMAPHLEKLAKEHDEKIKIVKLNIENNLATAKKYEVGILPTLLIFKDGEVIDQMKGKSGLTKLKNFIGKHI